MQKKYVLMGVLLAWGVGAWASEVREGSVTCNRYIPGLTTTFECWAPADLKEDMGATYVFLEWNVASIIPLMERLMTAGTIPSGICISFGAGRLVSPSGQFGRGMRACTFDQPGSEFPSAIAEEVIPAAEKLLGVRASRNPDLGFIAGASSGGIAAWNACWYRNDRFHRAYCNSPTFSNMRGGHQLMPLVRKCEARPIRAYLTCGTDEPDFFFGDSYFVAEDAVGALRFAGYEVCFERMPHAGHGARWGNVQHLGKVLTWLFEDWNTKPVTVTADPIRVRDVLVKGSEWEACNFVMPPAITAARSSDGGRLYSVAPTNHFVMSELIAADGSHRQRICLAPLELPWNATRVGGTALAIAADDRIWVATELGVQSVVSFGLLDVILPLPGDLPCDNVALVGTNLYAASGARVFHRYVRYGATDPTQHRAPATPGYGNGFWYSRDHEPPGGIGELLGSYVTAGRIAGVVSALSDDDYHEQYDCAGWARNYGSRCKDLMTPETLFTVPSLKKSLTCVAIMCAIDDGKISRDDACSKYLTKDDTQSLERAIGEPYEKYLARKILEPLGMKDTTFHPNDEQRSRLAMSYTCDDTPIRRRDDVSTAQHTLYATPRDMMRFAQMFAHHGEWKGRRLISQKTFDAISTIHPLPIDISAGRIRMLFIQTDNATGSAFQQLKRAWSAELGVR